MDNNNTMEYRIGLEKQNKRNDQVTELILDNCRASQISGLTDEFVNLETLSLINVGLVTLKGFPKLPKLKKLELSDNRLTGGLNLLHGSSKLQHLNISGNRIKDLEALEPLKEFHDLANLDLYNCEVTKLDDYRQKVFDLLPNLHSLDGYDFNEREVADSDESEDEGSDVENRITRDDNDLDDVEDEDEEDDESSEYAEEDYNGLELSYENDDQNDEEGEDDDDDEEDDEDDDDDDDDEESEEWGANEAQVGAASTADSHNSRGDEIAASSVEDGPAAVATAAALLTAAANEDDCLETVENVENGEEDEEGEDGIDDEEEEGEDGDGSDLKQLQKDIGEDEDSDDDDFEPSHEPDERDYEIDPEDDADEEQSSALLSTSNLDATASSEADDTKLRGQKRKLEPEDEGGDEVGED